MAVTECLLILYHNKIKKYKSNYLTVAVVSKLPLVKESKVSSAHP